MVRLGDTTDGWLVELRAFAVSGVGTGRNGPAIQVAEWERKGWGEDGRGGAIAYHAHSRLFSAYSIYMIPPWNAGIEARKRQKGERGGWLLAMIYTLSGNEFILLFIVYLLFIYCTNTKLEYVRLFLKFTVFLHLSFPLVCFS